MKKITDYLISLGLTKIEGEIYQGLLQAGPTTVKELSEFLRMKRITTHFNVEGLIEKGLIVQTMHGARRKIMAEEPTHIQYLIEQKEKEITYMKDKLPAMLRDLKTSLLRKTGRDRVDVRYYKGGKAVNTIYQEALKATEIRSFVNIKQIFKLFPDNPEVFPKTILKGNLKMREIIENSPFSKKYIQKVKPHYYQYKFFPDSWNQDIFFDYMIFHNTISIITVEGAEPIGIVIQNNNVYEHTKFIFDLIWSLLPEVK